MLTRPLASLFILATSVVPLHAAQPQFWKIEGPRSFLEGSLDGLSVDSDGRVQLAPRGKALYDPETPYVWCLARDAKGTLYAGTGNDGKVFKIEGGQGSLFFDAAELEVHALALGPDGRLYVGTSPDGKVYAVDVQGKAEVFFDPPERYIWALAFDRSGRLYVATGAEGKVHRVDKSGKAEVALTSSDTHVSALVLDGNGNLYAGSSPGGILYRLDAAGKVMVLHDSSFREVKALALGSDGSLYAALVEGKEREEAPRLPGLPPAPASIGAPVGEVTVTETFTVLPQAAALAPTPMPSPKTEMARSGSLKGALLRIGPNGDVDTLWSSPEEMPFGLVATSEGVVIATGNKGQLYRVKDDRSWTMLATLPAQQATALARGDGGNLVVATANPGRLHALEAGGSEQGSFVSKAQDAETVSRWGLLRFDARVPPGSGIKIHTRSGNTSTPDSTWSDWSPALRHSDGEAVVSPAARFLQVKAVLEGSAGSTPVLESVATAYLQRNLRPSLLSVTVHPPGEVFQKPLSITGEAEILGYEAPGPDPRAQALAARSGLPPVTAYARRMHQKGLQTFTWKAEDPNGDSLSYDLDYRLVGETRFKPLRKGLTEPVLAWDTTAVPNGRYLVRITASDAPSNPDELALSGSQESQSFQVDNLPPSLVATLLSQAPPRIRVVARDDASPLRRAEYSVDGGSWHEIHPKDGINDGLEETYEFAPSGLSPGPKVVVIRITDLLGNAAAAQLTLP